MEGIEGRGTGDRGTGIENKGGICLSVCLPTCNSLHPFLASFW